MVYFLLPPCLWLLWYRWLLFPFYLHILLWKNFNFLFLLLQLSFLLLLWLQCYIKLLNCCLFPSYSQWLFFASFYFFLYGCFSFSLYFSTLIISLSVSVAVLFISFLVIIFRSLFVINIIIVLGSLILFYYCFIYFLF